MTFSKVLKQKNLSAAAAALWACATLTVCALDAFIWRRELSGTERFYERVLVHIIFLNFTHIFFTYTMLFYVPEIRGLIKELLKNSGKSIAVFTFIIFCLAFFIFYRAGFGSDSAYVQLALMTNIILGTQHSLFQVKGMSRLLWPEPPAYSESLQKALYYVLFLLSIAPVLKKIVPGSLAVFNSSYLIFTAAAVTATLLIFRTLPSIKPGARLWFHSRLLLFPLSLFSTFASSFIAINHAQEYVKVFGLVSENSKMNSAERFRLKMLSVITIAIFSVFYFVLLIYKTPEFNDGLQPNKFLQILNAFLPAALITHYFIDRRLFEMASGTVRTHMLPLLRLN